jgi:PBP1b-binding outer membrane lipoprotein LpoB
MLNLLRYSLLLAGLLLLNSCSSVTKQSRKTTIMDASQEDTLGGTGTSSADIRSMAERMAREISGLKWPDNKVKVRIALTTIDNQTRFPINPNIIKDRLLTDLVEFSQGTKLQFTENANGADYFLSARLTALSKGSTEGVSDYLLYSFKLIDKADTVEWMKAYETKKQGSVGVMYR